MPFDSNGILAKVPGDLIGWGSQALPRAAAGLPAEMSVEMEAGHLGRVRITYRLASNVRGKWRNWFWSACFAEVVT